MLKGELNTGEKLAEFAVRNKLLPATECTIVEKVASPKLKFAESGAPVIVPVEVSDAEPT